MASRDASIRVSLRSGAFNSETKRMESRMRSVGRRMGTALRVPISAGLNAAKQSIAGIGNSLKGTIKTAATLGGALATGAMIKDAVKIQALYRNIAFSISKIPGHASNWQDIQDIVDASVDRTGKSAEDLANSFHEIFKSTGDAEYAAMAMDSVGIAATSTGESVDSLTQASQLLKRKFGVTESSLNDALTRFIQLTGSGGKSLDELTGRFAVMAGEARGAGMVGADGVSKLLGMLLLLDESIGEKADPGLKNLFQTLKTGTTQLKRIQKEGRIKIEPDANALDKIKKILSSKKARIAAQMTITSDARTVFDELAKPFDLALEEAKSKGLKKADALDMALKAFDENISKASKTTMVWDDILKQHSGRINDDPSVQLEKAINRIKKAFTQPKMIDAIGNLADKLPILADKIVWLVDFIVANPMTAVGAGMGLKVGGSFLTSALGNAGGTIFRKLFNVPMGKVLGGGTGTGGATGGGGVASSAGEVGLAFRGLANAGKGVTKKLAKLGEPFAGRSGVAGKAMLAASGLAAAGAAGYVLGDQLWDMVLKPLMDADFDKWEKADDVAVGAKRQLSQDQTIEQKMRTLEEIRKTRADVEKGPSIFTGVTGTMASLFSDVDSPAEMTGKKLRALDKAALGHEVAVRKQMASQLESAGQFNTKWNQLLFDPLKDLNTIMRQFKATMKDVNRNPGSSRGPSKVSNQHTPGSEDKRG